MRARCRIFPLTEKEKATSELVDTLESLSVQLTLNSLWDTLSACLKELAETPDHHAVLVLQVEFDLLQSSFDFCPLNDLKLFNNFTLLQPTLEAFYPVLAAVTSSEEKKKPKRQRRSSISWRLQIVPRVCRDTQDRAEPDSQAVYHPLGGRALLRASGPHQGA